MKALELLDIHKSFGEKKVLDGISLYLNDGEIIGLLGVSGSGKSTIFNIISGGIKPNSGKVILDGKDVTGEKGKVAYMQQKDLLFPHMNILRNTSLPLIISGEDKSLAHKEASDHFEEFGLKGTEDKYPSQLSGGMRQRAALLRTYLNKKSVILLDEPFSALDMITKAKMHDWFIDLMKKLKMSAIFITHDIDEAIFLSDRIYILGESGKITDEIIVEYGKIRGEEFKLSEEFLEYKRKISKALGIAKIFKKIF